ncbi:VOC family protein [Enteractinococcus coprophilus]|uniref:Putative 3-demethylubiquinone-9 3-methyltransferase (Glyoxalase superfamily) n=1 Tax=Enteractinococcus coprophilus TaxID=1027633 RepID=A0A543AP19_9MICC|nr:VOC family protein [Enteractinococcus coprophilus]TQL74322.1 putative 3-demethylubiquinone-9 3-methyltransferase (glyoxalase superfamily) [Enteractinococcus coprophilus]
MTDTQQLLPHLMFQNGRAEEAMNFYVELFDGEVLMLQRYGDETPDMNGKVQIATLRIAGLELNIMDSPVPHEFDFTPSMSLSFRCESEDELDRMYQALLEGGQAMMPKNDYGFAPFAWLNDRYGVSWQLNVAPHQE